MSRTLYRWLVRLHPPRFRQVFGGEMLWIFDQAARHDGAAALLADALRSLARQWALHFGLWERPFATNGAARASDGVPLFYTFGHSAPGASALFQGGILSIAAFAVVSFAFTYGRYHRPSPVRFAGFPDRDHDSPQIADAPVGQAVLPASRQSRRLDPKADWKVGSQARGLPHSDQAARAVLALAPLPAALLSAPAQTTGEPVVIGERLQIRSEILKETRPLLISKPAGYENETERYPVLYLLDGDTHFHHTTGIVRFVTANGPRFTAAISTSTGRGRKPSAMAAMTAASSTEIPNHRFHRTGINPWFSGPRPDRGDPACGGR